VEHGREFLVVRATLAAVFAVVVDFAKVPLFGRLGIG
jgi:hypothetical protein